MAGQQAVAAVAEHLLGGLPLVAVARAVGAVLAHMVLLADLLGQRIGVGHLGHAHVEGGVEHRDVGDARVGLAAELDDARLRVVVQRGERGDRRSWRARHRRRARNR